MEYKDEKNIKRRVYDALNVLVSAQVLKKDGKQVICEHSYPTNKNKKYEQEKAKEKQKMKKR